MVRSIVRLFLGSHLSILLLLAALLLGAAAVVRTPREEEPQIVVPMADVMVSFPGASAEECEELVARPLERLLWQIDGVEYVYSMARRERALVTVRFFVGEDRERSLIKLHSRIAMHHDAVPPGVAGWVIKPREIDDVAIVTAALWSKTMDGYALRRVAEEAVARLDRLDDLSRTEIVGGFPRRIEVRPDPARLAAYGIPLLELGAAIGAADASLDTGAFARGDRMVEVAAGPWLRTAGDLARVVVGVHAGKPIALEDVAEVRDGPAEPAAYSRIRFGPGHVGAGGGGASWPAVTLAFSKKKGTNAVAVAERVLEELGRLRGTVIPSGVEIEVTRNQGQTADAKVDKLLGNLVEAVVVMVVLVGLSMGGREAFIVAVSIPVSFGLALLVNWGAGYTINRVTLFALILALGEVVDDPITNVDNIQRHLAKGDRDPDTATLDGVEEVLPPVILSTLAIAVSYLPMLAITGMMGPYMAPMAFNVPLAVGFSLVAALTFVPWLSRALLAGSTPRSEEVASPRVLAATRRILTPLLATRRRGYLLLAGIGLALLGALALPVLRLVPLKMLPFDDKAELQLMVDLPEGSTVERTDAALRALEAVLVAEPDIDEIVAFAGVPSPIDFNGLVRHDYLREAPHLGELRIGLVGRDRRRRPSHSVALDLRRSLEGAAGAVGAKLKIVEVPPGPPVLATLVAEVYARERTPYPEVLAGGRELAARLASVPGVVDVDDYAEAPRTRLEYVLDKEKAALHGVSTEAVARTLAMALEGARVGILHVPGERQALAIEVRLPAARRTGEEELLALEVGGEGGRTVALAELGRLEPRPEDQPIYHKNLRRLTYIVADTAGRPPGEVVLDMQAELAARPLAAAVDVVWSGEGEWKITVDVFRDLGIAFSVALLGIYLLLVGQTGSLSLPLIVMLAVPLTGLGIFPGFWLMNVFLAGSSGGYPDPVFFTATAMIGMISLGGISVRSSIVLLDFIRAREEQGVALDEAIVEANAVRFRPIMLAALSSLVGSVPITTDPIFSGLAWSIIFGLTASTLFTLVVVPVVYKLVRTA